MTRKFDDKNKVLEAAQVGTMNWNNSECENKLTLKAKAWGKVWWSILPPCPSFLEVAGLVHRLAACQHTCSGLPISHGGRDVQSCCFRALKS